MSRVFRAFADTMWVMATAFASEAAHVKDLGHLSAPDIARATGADETTVRAWLRGARSPSGARAERLAELSAIVERMVRVMEPSYVPVWLRKRSRCSTTTSRSTSSPRAGTAGCRA